MGVEDVDVFLEHFGIKGMHWGIRNPKRADDKWKKHINSKRGSTNRGIAYSRKVRQILQDMSDDPKYKNLDIENEYEAWMNDPRHYTGPKSQAPKYPEILKQWDNDFLNRRRQAAKEVVNEVHGVSPSGEFKAVADVSTKEKTNHYKGIQVKIVSNKVKHDDVDIFLEYFGIYS